MWARRLNGRLIPLSVLPTIPTPWFCASVPMFKRRSIFVTLDRTASNFVGIIFPKSMINYIYSLLLNFCKFSNRFDFRNLNNFYWFLRFYHSSEFLSILLYLVNISRLDTTIRSRVILR